jgi:hypothetical protein
MESLVGSAKVNTINNSRDACAKVCNLANSGCLASASGTGARYSLLKQCISFATGTAGCFSSGHREESTVSLLLNKFSAAKCSGMFPELPTIEFGSQARRLAEGYRQARAVMLRPGDAAVAELDRQLGALRATVAGVEAYAWMGRSGTQRRAIPN